MKIVLGVRKSCDASIIMPLKNAFAGLSSSNERISHKQAEELGTTSNAELGNETVNLETAIQSRLNVVRDKPRSRSLIWRPTRRRSKNTSEPSDCQVS